jgi:hypothetical protein
MPPDTRVAKCTGTFFAPWDKGVTGFCIYICSLIEVEK